MTMQVTMLLDKDYCNLRRVKWHVAAVACASLTTERPTTQDTRRLPIDTRTTPAQKCGNDGLLISID